MAEKTEDWNKGYRKITDSRDKIHETYNRIHFVRTQNLRYFVRTSSRFTRKVTSTI